MERRSRLGSDERGAVAIMVALALLPLLGMAGLSVDAARAYLVEAKLSQALDAAALAGGRVMFSPQRDADIQRYFDANFPNGFLGAQVTPLSISSDATNENLTVSASATLDTSLMRLLGKKGLEVGARTVVHRESRGMELALVIDNTGSMQYDGKIQALRAGATELVQILFGQRERIPNVWVSLVPFVSTVNIGKHHTDWLVTNAFKNKNFNVSPQGWKGCVEARYADGNDVTDALPSQSGFKPYYFPAEKGVNDYPPVDESEYSNTQTVYGGKGPNLGCGPAVTPMLTDKSAILEAVGRMNSWHRGGTMTNLGMVWGWRILSPRWRGLWSSEHADLPLDYHTPYMEKVAVILTDGRNQFSGDDYSGYGKLDWGWLGTTRSSTAINRVNQRMAAVCNSMKQQGIIIYSITFQVDDSTTRSLFRSCATKPEFYYDSPSNEALRETFRQIGTTLSNLRLAQ